jgi:hypothetical protein
MASRQFPSPANVPAEWRAAAASLSDAAAALVDYAVQNPEFLRAASFPTIRCPTDGTPVHPWPTFLARARVEAMTRIGSGIARLIRQLPQRVMRNAPDLIASTYGVPAAELESVIAGLVFNDQENLIGRGDFIDSDEGFLCLEHNLVGWVGGWESLLNAQNVLASPMVQRFIEAQNVRYRAYDPLAAFLRYAIKRTRALGLADESCNVLALQNDTPNLQYEALVLGIVNAVYENVLRTQQPPLSGRVLAAHHTDLTGDGPLFCKGHRIAAILSQARAAHGDRVVSALRKGSIALFNGPAEPVLSDKRNLAHLWSLVGSPLLTAEESRLIREHVAWTHVVAPQEALVASGRAWLPGYISANRERLVLKQATTFGGENVFIGRATSPSEWEAALATAMKQRDWVVQPYIESKPFPYQNGEESLAAHAAIWGVFTVGSEVGGVFLRISAQTDAVVNSARGALDSVVLEVEH